MIDTEAKLEAIRQGTTPQPPEVEAIGVVFAEILRPVTLQPFPWPMVDALRAIDAAAKQAEPAADNGEYRAAS
jgi:hypothetical protein